MQRSPWNQLGSDPVVLLRSIGCGYWSARALASAIELGLFSRMEDREWLPAQLARELGVSERGLEVLLRFSQVAGLVVFRPDGSFAATSLGRQLLDPTREGYVGHELGISDDVWHAFEFLTETVRRKRPFSALDYFASLDDAQRSGFMGTMHSQGEGPAAALAGAVDTSGIDLIADIGCGAGTFSVALLRRNPLLRAFLIDLPAAVGRTEAHLVATGMRDRVLLVAGDFWKSLPVTRYDGLLLSKILHDWDDERCASLLRRCTGPLPRGGLILIHEEMIHDPSDPDWWPVMVDLFIFARMGGGRTRTVHELEALLTKADCTIDTVLRLDGLTSAIVGRKC